MIGILVVWTVFGLSSNDDGSQSWARIVFAAAEGETNKAIAETVDAHPVTVGKWRRRFVEAGIDGLHDEPRPGAPRTVTDADVEAVIVKTLEEQPADATHWSTRSMAAATGMSQTMVSKIWRAFGLKPHLVDEFKLSPDPLFIDKVRDIVGLYLKAPEAAVVLCVDEKTQVQALDRTAPILPMLPGVPERRTHDYAAMAPPTCTPRSMSPPATSSPT